jgi:truncated hemoglobin YjbI
MDAERPRRRRTDLTPDPELWAALGEGKLLKAILDDFYARVFRDPALRPFFGETTEEWVAGKQHAFLKQILTGEDCYFGDRPRNAHHWMVVSEELFTYREELLEKVMREHGLDERFVKRWRAIDECFRKQIVKDAPRPKMIRGQPIPFEGYEALVLDAGTLCDGCEAVLDPGTTVRYHVRTGKAFCATCVPGQTTTRPPPHG